jgi:hypothetical protein
MDSGSPTPAYRQAVHDTQHAQFPTPPLNARHLYVVCRFDGFNEGSDPTAPRAAGARGRARDPGGRTEKFILTRGYLTESEAQNQAARLNPDPPLGTVR